LQVTFASRDKETALQALAALQAQHDHLSFQQAHWDDLRQASEKIDTLTTLIGQADNEELKELRRYRDRSKVLEGEHAALQKRFKEQESKIANSERASLTARQSLAQAQQRSSEWERRAKDYEGQLELTQTKLDQAEQTQAQLDADYALVKLQLEEREADDRLAKVIRMHL
jgi:chromosome segregation ATPase